MAVVLIALFAVSAVAPLLFRRFGRASFYLLGAVPAAAFVWLLVNFDSFISADQSAAAGEPNAPPGLLLHWIPVLQLDLAFRMDALAAVLSLLILGVGALVLFYCARYFKNEDANIGPFGAQLLAFAGAMFGLVIADDLILLFIFWEITTILSYLLVGFARTRIFARRSALQALLVTTFGGLAMLLGLVMIGQTAGTYRLSEIMAMAPELASRGTLIDIAIALVLLGAVSKSALVPFHFWLPGAMAAPTPVSAYLHAAAMVKAGVYLVARLAPGFSGTTYWDGMIIGLGLATMLVGGWRALRQTDIKLVLAYGTVSQLGFIMLVVGQGTADAALAGLALMLAHGFFKAALFLVVGIIDHQAGTRDVRLLSGLWRTAPKLFVVAVISAASMAGIPPLYGFVAKESVLEVLLAGAHDIAGIIVFLGVLLGSVFTVAYSARFIWGGFASKPGMPATAFKAVPWSFLAAPAVLTAATVVFGFLPTPLGKAAAGFASLFPASEHPVQLALWHGPTPVLGFSVLVIAAGLLVHRWRAGFGALQSRVPALLEAEQVYKWSLNAVDEVSVWTTGRTQRGSLPFYLGVILLVALVVPAVAGLTNQTPLPENIVWFDTPAQLIAGLCMIVGALAAIRANRRFLAVLMVSVTGYGMAFIFALQGAPDLALTQLLVETIVLVAMVLALRVLPPPLWTLNPTGHRMARALLGIGFGVAMIGIAAAAMASRTADPVSLSFPELAYFGGAGKNIVNVTLVDIRVWDTFGEITVLAVAATGVASLIFVRGRGDIRHRVVEAEPGSVGRARPQPGGTRAAAALATARHFAQSAKDAWLVAGKTLAPERRSIIFEVVARLVFHTIIIFSIYLLLAGHNSPGGGFAGGLLAGLALTIRYLAGGRFELAEATPISPGTLLGLGLATSALSGVVPLLLGGQLFQTAVLEFALPVFGEQKFVTSTFFDIGVYLVVVGLVVDVLRSLGSEIDEKTEKRGLLSGGVRRPRRPVVQRAGDRQ
ncbi:MAG: Na+/H+ antiporter subunit A [Micrococcaceae bacterium]|uniref:Na+/H+ antiporter subunit A n=1 Tax=Arthrobacter sp. 179 TaxID=3457734 RepID=UPI0026529F60|nr:Na+/H+ antiporter subunit A [Micrococcaceae bacterium]MDN5812657.1 Na+/H+ antiporter subunit A [Micrococcaceae bacterium]MDN5879234.1 Na+/H+ antiporter subunit A [Micrococcaceae bacterium]MDN5887226.1 Na+/H+ antiporter subunit A [Micrococcaceae bacterium]MDN5905482.1 Na+/H+ antiporter subunit A [Micrococcaceae bacterium]